jgi:hypothetical protein
MIIVLRIPRIHPIGVMISSEMAGSIMCWRASWMKGRFQPGSVLE